ncbi:hypothetical protein GCM10009106_02950 [Sphingomonas japonica]
MPRAEPPPPPVETPAPAPAPTPPPTPAPAAVNWADLPPTPGDWVYRRDERGSIALFGRSGADADFTIRCDRAAGQLFLSRRGSATGPATMTIRTTSATRALTARPTGGTPAYVAAAVTPRDSLLDAMGFSRGRVLVAVSAMPQLVLPSWAEILRVTEDCRA